MYCPRKKRPTRDEDFSAMVVPSVRGLGYLDYNIESHASRSLSAMDEFRRHDLLCDLVLRVTQKDRTVDFKVHKLVLASASPYFRAMFSSSFKEGRASEVTLRDACPLVVGKLIDFAYTARITVGENCVLHVLLGAMRYQMEDVAKACCDFLVKHLEPANVIGIARFAEGLGCTELQRHSREYINTHFNEVTKVEEFFSLTHCQLLELISQDSIKVLCESEVYQACTNWVRWDIAGRAQYLHALLNAVRIYALPPKFLKNQLQSCPILSKDNCCKDFLSKIFQEMALKKPLPPAPLRGNQLIYVAGGYHHRSLPTMEAFDPGRNVWLKLANMEAPCSGLGACVVFGLFYTVGGRNLSVQANTESGALCCYNPMTNRWTSLASLNAPRNRVGVGVVDGAIYAVGGSQGSAHHATVERWDPDTNRWSLVCPMAVARLGAGVASCGGALYVVGGYDGLVRWDSAERYQPDTNTWHPLAPMGTVRSGLGLVCLDACLYATGGFDGRSQLCSVERYSIARDCWEPQEPMSQCRSAHAVTVHQGRIFVLGGFNQTGFLSSVEVFCPDTNTWTGLSDMPFGRSGMGIAVTMEPCPGNLPEEEEEEEEEEDQGGGGRGGEEASKS
ncbi:kelch-like ECH-associated protein 1A [Gadus macrocephalus]|uniref:kelch-like ECH-associated protein 1A n=1 Tax=Gadus macrocephalus TaxID=80720 RepID=UPI0028CBAD9C|nr:kelch-like ECH-associated protein 1A [Gadus macrocephalus]